MSIGEDAFVGCEQLTRVDIPSVEDWLKISFANAAANPLSMGAKLFVDGEEVSDLVIPEGVTEIGSYAFRGGEFVSVTLPGCVKNVAATAFSGCVNIKTVVCPAFLKMSACFPDSYAKIDALSVIGGSSSLPVGFCDGCAALTQVSIPAGVEMVGERAFAGCGALTHVDLPVGVRVIEANAFTGCSSLSRVDIPTVDDWLKISFANSTANPLSTGAKLFVGGEEVTNLVIPEGVTEIGEYAFQGGSFASVTIPNGMTNVAPTAFTGCSNIVGVTIGGVPRVAIMPTSNWMRQADGSWRSNAISPKGRTDMKVTVLGPRKIVFNWKLSAKHFDDCLRWYVDGVQQSEHRDSVVDADWVTVTADVSAGWHEISWAYSKEYPFDGSYYSGGDCGYVMLVSGFDSYFGSLFPDSYAKIKSVSILSDVSAIPADYFAGCEGLARVGAPSVADWLKINFGNGAANPLSAGARLFVDDEEVVDLVIPEDATEIGDYAFQGGRFISVTIPSRVTNVAPTAFSGCTNIVAVTCPALVNMRALFPDSYAKIESVAIVGGASNLVDGFCTGCSALSQVELPVGVQEIGMDAFVGCGMLARVDIPSIADWLKIDFANGAANPLSVGAKLYVGGEEVTDLRIPEGVTEIGEYAFWDGQYTSVSIPNGVTNIAPTAFMGCLNLLSVSLGCIPSGSCEFSPPMTELGAWQKNEDCCFTKNSGVMSCAVRGPCKLRFNWQTVFGYRSLIYMHYMIDGVEKANNYNGDQNWHEVQVDISEGEHVVSWEPCFYNESYEGRGENRVSDVVLLYDHSLVKALFPSSYASLTNLILQKGVRTVPREFFEGCASLERVDIQPGLKLIETDAFVGCESLSRVDVPSLSDWMVVSFANAAANPLSCGAKLFVGGAEVSELEIPDGTTEIGEYAFSGGAFSSVILPNSVTNVATTAFAGCENIVDVEIDCELFSEAEKEFEEKVCVCDGPKGDWTDLGNGQYRSKIISHNGSTEMSIRLNFNQPQVCSFKWKVSSESTYDKLEYTVDGVKITNISGSKSWATREMSLDAGEHTIVWRYYKDYTGTSGEDCGWVDISELLKLNGTVTVTYSVKRREMMADLFPDSVAGIKTVKIAGDVAVIDEAFLAGCSSLETLVVGDNVKRIEAGVIDDCVALESLTLPPVSQLEDYGLDLILDSMRGTVGYDGNGFMIKDGWLLDYKDKGASEVVVPEGVIGIGHYALAYMEDLEWVSLPSTLKYIASAAFVEDTYLDDLVIPDSVEYIGKGAFEDCSWIQTMTVGSGVREIADRAFAGCSYMGVVKLPLGLESIGEDAFADCRKMPSISLPASVKHVGSSAFTGCAALTGITTPTSVAPMSEWFKPVYKQIRDVTVSAGETEVCSNMFKGCAALVSAALPEGVERIGEGAFMDCTSLSSVELPSTLRSIGADAFNNCDALTAIGLPDAVERIGARAFYGCARLKDMSLSKMLGELPDQAFDECAALDSIVVQAAVSNLGARVFGNAMSAAYYLGDAPSYDEEAYAATPSRFVTYVKDGSRGWDGIPQSRNLPRNWPNGNASARAIATWTPVRYDVTFDAGDGLFVSPVPAQTYACEQTVGTVYSLPPYNPARRGWKFDGWWTEESGGTRITPSTRVVLAKAHTLYAHWTQGQLITVRFNANGGTVNPGEAEYVADVPYGEFPVPTREHFVFDGWFTEPQRGVRVRISMEAPKADRELFAHWLPAQYSIRFNANNGTRLFVMQNFIYGQTVVLRPNHFICPGCTFAGWSLMPGGEAVYADCKTIENLAAIEDGVIDLYAVWAGNNYAVRFDSNGGQGTMANQTFVVGVSQPLQSCAFVRYGYEFLGWALSPSGQIRYKDGEEVEGLALRLGDTVELYAVWGIEGMKSTVTFDPNGGTVETASVEREPGEPFGDLPVPVRDGWVFAGWHESSGALVTSDAIVPPGAVKLTAAWGGRVRIVLRFREGFHWMMFAAGHPFGRLPALPRAQAPWPRYRFRGWAYDIAGTRLVSPTDIVPEEEIELYAVWVPEEETGGDEPLVEYDEAGLVIWDGWLLDCEDKSAMAIDIPEGVVGIGQGALANMYDLQTVRMPSTLREIAAGAFAYDTSLDNLVIPNGVESIGEDAFAHCTALQTLTLGKGLKHVAAGAFRDCAQLAKAVFSVGLENVGAETFAGCWRMQSVSLSLSVTNVAESAFEECVSLTGVTVPTSRAPLSEWFRPVYAQIRDVTVSDGETTVCSNMFKGCSALVSVALPEGVTNLADGAFWDCTSLPSFTLPSSLVALGDDVFRNCRALTAAGLPEGVERIGARAFCDCVLLRDVALSAKLVELPDQVFDGCSRLDSLVVPEAVTNLGARVFGDGLSSVFFVGNAPQYDDDAYASTKSGLTTYVKNGTKGWEGRDKPTSRALPDTWPVDNPYSRPLTTWEPVQYDVTFDAGEGVFPSVAESTYACRQTVGTAYALPPFNPMFKAHKFAGWWTETVGGTQVTPSTGVKLQKEHALYAHWTEGVTVTVRFNACGGSVDTEELAYTAEVPFGSFPVPTREHYEFVGWFTERIGGEMMRTSTEVPKVDRELFAHWVPKTYQIRFNAINGRGDVAYQDYVYGQTVTLHGNIFACAGCQFAGWSLTPGGAAVYGDRATLQEVSEIRDGVIDLYAVWAGNVYVVRFDSHGGVGDMANQTFVIGVSMPLAHCAFTRRGYIFRGWSRTTTGSVDFGDMASACDLTLAPSSAVTLYAVWERDPDAEWSVEDYLNCTNLSFTLGGDLPHWYGEKTSRADKAGMMRSGAIGDMQTNWLQTVVSGSGTIGFWWKANGEFEKSKEGVITRYDYAEFTVDGVPVEEIGDESEWTYVTVSVEGAGLHVLRWMYHKDESGSDGDDCAWLSEVTWEPDAETEVVPTIAELAEVFGGESDVVKGVKDDAQLAAFNQFLKDCAIASASDMSAGQKTWAYQSFKLSEVMTAPQLFEEEPVLKFDDIELNDGNLALTVSLHAGAEAITLAKDKLAERIRVGTSLDAIVETPQILASPSADGTSLTFTVTPPQGDKGFVRILIE